MGLKKIRDIFDLKKWQEHTLPEAKDWVEAQFPREHYGENIWTYEAWSLRALLEQAFMAGIESVSEKK